MTFLSEMDESTGLLDGSKAHDKGLDLQETYMAGDPFPHIAIDNFLPEAVLERCLAEFPTDTTAVTETFDRNQERFKPCAR